MFIFGGGLELFFISDAERADWICLSEPGG